MMNPAMIAWIVDDDASIRWVVEKTLARAGVASRQFADAQSCLDALESDAPDVIITDLRMPGMDGHELMTRLNRRESPPPVIVISAQSDIDTVLRAFEGGAVELLSKPFEVEELLALVLRFASRTQEKRIEKDVAAKRSRIIGNSAAMQPVFRIIGRLSRTSMTVLITGESGSGKELIARTLHDHSPRRDKPFVALNTAAIPGELLESELFGHERGAFTGAHQKRTGRFEQADGGTLFLDEIGDMPLDMQTRLLRVLSENEFFRVGGHEPICVNVRIIAATHQHLETLVGEGRFREDLFHRLNVVHIRVPSLRERRDDISELLDHYLHEAAHELAVEPKRLSREARQRLLAHPWPGNVRELRNFCRRMTALAPGIEIQIEDLASEMPPVPGSLQGIAQWIEQQFDRLNGKVATSSIEELEKMLIRSALQRTNGHKQEAAKLLGWGRNTLTRKLQDYKLD